MTMKMADANLKMILLILGVLFCVNINIGFGAIISVTYDKTTKEYNIHPYEAPNWVALADYKNEINTTG